MLKQFIEKIQELVEDANKITEYTMDNGDTYTERDLKLIRPYIPHARCMDVYSLTSFVANLKEEIRQSQFILPIRVLVHEQSVSAFTSLDEDKGRENVIRAVSQNPDITFNRYISVEEMIIQLQTNFLATPNRDTLVSMISKLSKGTKVEVSDDGITQTVTASEGVSLKGDITLPPLVKLIPMRTFYEVEQPEQLFLLRVDKNCGVALIDAAGGSWKYDCQKSIRNYLSVALEEEIQNRTVILG